MPQTNKQLNNNSAKTAKRAETALKDSGTRYRRLFETAQDGILILDADTGEVTDVNPYLIEMLGFSHEEFLGKKLWEIGSLKVSRTAYQELQEKEYIRYDDLLLETKDGQHMDVEFVSNIYLVDHKRVIQCNIRDITGRVRTQEEYQTIISTTMDGFWITDMQGHFLDVNGAYCHLIGYSREELLEMLIQDVEAAEKPEETARHIQRIMETGHDRFETQHSCKDGRIVDIEVSVNFRPSHGGQFYVFLRDITVRKQVEQELQKAYDELERRVQERSAELAKANDELKIKINELKHVEATLRDAENRYRELWEGAPIALLSSTPSGQILDVNSTAVAMLRYPDRAQLLKVNTADLYLNPDERSRVLVQANAGKPAECQFRRYDSSAFWALLRIRPTRDAAGQVTHYEISAEDIVERKRAEGDIRRENDTRTVINTLLRLSLEEVSLDELLTQALDLILSIPWLSFESRGAIFLAEDDQFLVLKSQRGLAEPILRACARVPFGRCLCGLAAAGQKTRFANHLDVHHEITYEGIGSHGHYCVPILSAGKTLGVINIYLREGHRRDIKEEKFLLAIADTLAGSIERKRGDAILKKLSSVVEQATDLVFITDYDGIIEYVNPAFERLTGYTKDESIGQTPRILKSGKHTPDEYKQLWETIRAGRVLQGTVGNRKKNGELFYEEKIIKPLRDEQGNITHFVSTGHDITERKRAEEQIERQIKNLKAMHAIDTAIAGSFDLRLTLNIVLEQIIIQSGIDAADVLLFNPYNLTLEYAFGRGFRSKAIESSRVRLGEGHAGRAALERRTVHISDLSAVIEEFVHAELLSGENFVTYTGVPLIAKGEVKGMLEVYRRTPFDPSTGSLQVSEPEWLSFLEILAGQVAVAVDSAKLFTDLQRSNIELSIAYDDTIEGWSRALDLRDEETEGHTQRVNELTQQLARGMGMNEAELVHIRRGCLLHDIGKMGIPDNILRKPGPLTDEEWVIMRKHPQFAFEMLSPIAYLRPALDIPGCHHEKWDGSGYPRGLKGKQIPLAARLFAVIDVYDALTSDRPYRKAWSREKTLEYIKTNSGTHFDPKVVDAFLRVMNET